MIPWIDGGQPPHEEREQETAGLVHALGCELAFLSTDRIRKPSPSHLLSGGILERVKGQLQANDANIMIVDSALTPVQQRNLERDLGVKVIDRTGLILEIFGLRARTKEGVIQVELARLLYERSRLVRTWTHLERQRGGRGFLAGPGESQLEADRRMLDRRLKSLRSDLDAVRQTRGLQRAGRRRAGTLTIALVGYTNAGKSTLFNALTGADVFAKDMPFATLDPTIRRLTLPTLGDATLVDTVGFITALPTHLIDSFQATLEESMEADLIVHVRDRSSPYDAEQNEDVLAVLAQLAELSDHPPPPLIEAWNKADAIDEDRRDALATAAQMAEPEAVLVSARTGLGLEDLVRSIEQAASGALTVLSYDLPPSAGDARAWLYAHGEVLGETVADDGVSRLTVRMQPGTTSRFERMFRSVMKVD